MNRSTSRLSATVATTPGAPMAARSIVGAAALSEQMTLGPYRLIRLVGRGGMAEVYEAEVLESTTGRRRPRRVAVKRMLPQLTTDPEFIDMFCDEAVVHSSMSHRAIPRLLDFAEHGGEVLAVLEYVDGSSLARLLHEAPQEMRRMPPGAALYVAHEVLEALDHAHGARDHAGRSFELVHRDVSPSNILIARTGEVKLIDFGIARVETLGLCTPVGTLKGKLGYMSPEQIEGQPVDRRSDLFSLAVVLAELLLGRPLFEGRSELALLTNGSQPCLDVLRSPESALPPAIVPILERALHREACDRYQSAASFAEAVREAAGAIGASVDCLELCDWLSGSRGALASGVFPAVDRRQRAMLDIESVRRRWRQHFRSHSDGASVGRTNGARETEAIE